MANQNWFYTSQVKDLKNDIAKNLAAYKDGTLDIRPDKVAVMANVRHPEGLLAKMLPLASPEKDFDAAVAFYEAYPSLPPLIASMERFWCYLAHIELFPYVAARYDFVKAKNEVNYVKDHWFCDRIMRHALANLWWGVRLSRDESAPDDPYHLTRILFSNYSLRTRWLTVLLRLPNAIKGMLEHMEENQETFEGKYEIRGRFLSTYLNRLGSAAQLSFMPKDYFKNVCDSLLGTTAIVNNRDDLRRVLGDVKLPDDEDDDA